jgi:hypothetical protein
VSRELVIIPSGDQDGTGAAYIRPNWPEVREYDFSGINFGYIAQNQLAPEVKTHFSPEWTRENLTTRGPLGALYRIWGDGKQMVKGKDPMDYFGLSGFFWRSLTVSTPTRLSRKTSSNFRRRLPGAA